MAPFGKLSVEILQSLDSIGAHFLRLGHVLQSVRVPMKEKVEGKVVNDD